MRALVKAVILSRASASEHALAVILNRASASERGERIAL
jgi:hypothetical protein